MWGPSEGEEVEEEEGEVEEVEEEERREGGQVFVCVNQHMSACVALQ